MENEKVLSEDSWKGEASAVIKDIKNHVKTIDISKTLPNCNNAIYLNLLTLENKKYCIELTGAGFTIVGENFDSNNISTDIYYETPYGLLNNLSTGYQKSFGNELASKLNNLEKNMDNCNDEN